MAITRGRLCGRVYAACVYVSGHWPSAAREREREKETTISLMVSAKAVVKINTKKEREKTSYFRIGSSLLLCYSLPSFFHGNSILIRD
jgi:hypothetical protein